MSRLDTTERPIRVAAEAPSVDVTSVVMAAVSSSMPKVMPILAIMPTWIGTSAKASENGMGAAAADAARPAAMFTSISARFFYFQRLLVAGGQRIGVGALLRLGDGLGGGGD